MRKRRTCLVLWMAAAFLMVSGTVFAYDGTTYCTFGTGGAGTGILSINSSAITGTSSWSGKSVKVLLNYQYTNSSGQIKVGTSADTRVSTASTSVSLPAGTSERKARSTHEAINLTPVGRCSLW